MSGALIAWLLTGAGALGCGDADTGGLDTRAAEAVTQGIEQFQATGGSPGAAGLLGMVLHANGLDVAAADCYRVAGLGEPGDVRWAYLAGVVAENEGLPEEAMASYWAALRAQPEYAPAAVRLATLLREAGATEAASLVLARFDREDATPALQAALGEQALAAEDHERAEALLRSALAAHPEADRLYYLLGRALQAQGKDTEAREALARRGATGLAPADPILEQVGQLEASETPALLLGRRAYQAGQYEQARASFAEALDRNPDSIPARVNLATTLSMLGQTEEAKRLYEATLELAPDNQAALFNLAALEKDVAPERAAERYRRLIELNPTDAEAHFQLGLVLADLGEVDEALAAFDRARADLDYFPRASMQSVSLLVANGREAEAVAYLEHARSIAPRDPALATALISLWTTARDLTVRNGEAALDLARDVFNAMGDSNSARLVAQAHAELNQCDAAKTWLQTAAGLSQSDAMAQQLRAVSESISTPCRRPAAGDAPPSKDPG